MFPCSKCTKVYQHRTALARHEKTNCIGKKSGADFLCSKCNKSFDRKDCLNRHLKGHLKEKKKKKTKCFKCGKDHPTEWHLRRHLQTCKNKCSLCKHILKDDEEHDCKVIKVLIDVNKRKKSIKKKNMHAQLIEVTNTSEPDVPDGFHDLAFAYTLLHFEWGWRFGDKEKNGIAFNNIDDHVFENIDFNVTPASVKTLEYDPTALRALTVPATPDIELEEKPASVNETLEYFPTPSKTLTVSANPEIELENPSSPAVSLVSARVLAKAKQLASEYSASKNSSTMAIYKDKTRFAEDIAVNIKTKCLVKNHNEKDIIKLVVKYLDIEDEVTINHTRKGRITDIATRQNVWEYYHEIAEESTNTTYIAKLSTSKQPYIQSGLEYKSTVRVVTKRNREFYQSIWLVVTKTFREIHNDYLIKYPNHYVSLGTFFALKPFYIRHASSRDLAMCCCKIHLHIRWAVQALVKLLDKQNISIQVSTYSEFLGVLCNDCDEGDNTYISWECTRDKKEMCEHISLNWEAIKNILIRADPRITILFNQFKKIECYNKEGVLIKDNNGQTKKKITAVKEHVNILYLMEFIDLLLPKIIHHRNHLRLYRNIIHQFYDLFSCVLLDIDFSENLTILYKEEIQSLYYNKKQITVHSGILKVNGEKSYHPYLSDSRIHDQSFVKLAILEMLSYAEDRVQLMLDVNVSSIIIESDNCTSQYKSSHHFHDLQQLSNMKNKMVIRVYGIAEHGKGEVDHVGGVAKIAIRQEIARGKTFLTAAECCAFLDKKFSDSDSKVDYHIVQLTEDELAVEREQSSHKAFHTVNGCSKFQVMVFQPNQEFFKAAPRLCLCIQCVQEYGSCDLFAKYYIRYSPVGNVSLRSSALPTVTEEDGSTDTDFIVPNTFVAVLPPKGKGNYSNDAFWLIQVIDVHQPSKAKVVDSYGIEILQGQSYVSGHFLERVNYTKKSTIYKLDERVTCFYKETVVYPYVDVVHKDDDYLELPNTVKTDIILYMEQSGYSHI